MVHKVGQAVPFSFLLKDASGVPATGKAPTYTVVSNANVAAAPVAATEDAGGRYLGTFTPDAAGTWKVQVDCLAPVAHEEYNLFVGIGVEEDIYTALGTLVNTGGTATLGSIIGDVANSSIAARLTAIAGYIDTEVGTIVTNTNHISADYGATEKANINHVGADYGATEKANIDRLPHFEQSTIFWSPSQISVTLPAGAADQALPSVVLPNWTGTITHVYAGFKFRMLNNAGAANKLNGAQYIQTNNAAEGLDNAIALVDDQFGIAAATREGGDVVMGNIDLQSSAHPVDAFNVTVAFRWTAANADVANLVFNDVQTFLIVKWY